MSEYQYYEFLARDRPLTDKQRAELRSLSTRAEIAQNSPPGTYGYCTWAGCWPSSPTT